MQSSKEGNYQAPATAGERKMHQGANPTPEKKQPAEREKNTGPR
jgi:hypothetical protein